jgi:GT2 family glycosyltransferase/glycosyltransferase involved in cell wall biosynthesis
MSDVRDERFRERSGRRSPEAEDAVRRLARIQDTLTTDRNRISQLEAQLGRRERAAADADRLRRERDRLARLAREAQVELEAIAEYSERIGGSQSWRFGHRLARLFRLLTLRRPMRSDGGPSRLAQRASREAERLAAELGTLMGSAGDDTGTPRSLADPGPRDAVPIPPEQIARAGATGPVAVIVPVHNAPQELRRCLDSVIRNTDVPAELLVIDDASTDPAIPELLEAYGRKLPGMRVIRNERNLGFPATINLGFESTEGDVVILNSDTEVGPGWLRSLRLAASASDDVATATPLSDNAGAFSAPDVGVANGRPLNLTPDDAARLVGRASERLLPEIPVGNGFCMYVKRAAIEQVGGFDAEAFGRGYGEENDFCLRAAEAGWRHVLDDGGLVFHERSASFGERDPHEAKQTRALIDQRHPGYGDKVKAFLADPEVRRARLNVADAYRADSSSAAKPRLLYVVHAGGGGTPHTSADLLRALADRYDPYLFTSDTKRLRLAAWRGKGLEELGSWPLDPRWNVMDQTREDYRAVAASVLRTYAFDLVHVRHLFKHTFDLPELAGAMGIPVVLSFHDGYFACPTVHLLDENLEYCGGVCTPGDGQCYLPSPSLQTVPHLKHDWVFEWRRRVGEMLESVEACATASEHSRTVVSRALPQTTEVPFEVIEHGRDLRQVRGLGRPPSEVGDEEKVRILVAGNFNVRKGASVLAGISANDHENRLEFHFIGKMAPGFEDLGVIHGPYERDTYNDLVRQIRPSFAACLAIVAESYSHVLTEAWAAGLPVLASDHGAFRERVLRHGGGWLLDHRDPAGACERILEICDDPREYAQVAAEAGIEGIPTTSEMADGYDRLYGEVLARRRTLAGPTPGRGRRRLLDVDAVLPGRPGRRPGSSHVRCIRRHEHPSVRRELRARERDPSEIEESAVDPDVVLVQRHGLDPDRAPEFARAMGERGIPLVLELDDNLFEPRDASTGTADQRQIDTLVHLAGVSSLTIVSTPPLAAVAREHAERVAIVPNMLDERLWMPADGEPDPTFRRTGDRGLRILYMGSLTHSRDLDLLRPAFDLLADQGTEIQLEVVGGEPRSNGDRWYERTSPPPNHSSYPRFVPWLRSQRHRWDLAVAPLEDTPFNRCKSDLKLLEYAALGLPGAYSDVGVYESCRHEENGLLVSNEPEAWAEAIMRLARDSELREQLAREAFGYVADTRCLGEDDGGYVEALRSVA